MTARCFAIMLLSMAVLRHLYIELHIHMTSRGGFAAILTFHVCLQDLQLEALRSTELSGGMGRPGSSEDLASPPSLGSVGKTGSGIHPELVDLTCMLSPGSSNSQEGQRDEVGLHASAGGALQLLFPSLQDLECLHRPLSTELLGICQPGLLWQH